MLQYLLYNRQAMYTQALTHFHQSAKLQPVSSASWAYVALLKQETNQYDTVFWLALENAKKAAPWNAYVEGILIKTRLSAWFKLSQNMRLKLINDLELAIKQQPRKIYQLIRETRRQWAICNLEVLPQGLEKFCSGK